MALVHVPVNAAGRPVSGGAGAADCAAAAADAVRRVKTVHERKFAAKDEQLQAEQARAANLQTQAEGYEQAAASSATMAGEAQKATRALQSTCSTGQGLASRRASSPPR